MVWRPDLNITRVINPQKAVGDRVAVDGRTGFVVSIWIYLQIDPEKRRYELANCSVIERDVRYSVRKASVAESGKFLFCHAMASPVFVRSVL